jgi:hypothetical protein
MVLVKEQLRAAHALFREAEIAGALTSAESRDAQPLAAVSTPEALRAWAHDFRAALSTEGHLELVARARSLELELEGILPGAVLVLGRLLVLQQRLETAELEEVAAELGPEATREGLRAVLTTWISRGAAWGGPILGWMRDLRDRLEIEEAPASGGGDGAAPRATPLEPVASPALREDGEGYLMALRAREDMRRANQLATWNACVPPGTPVAFRSFIDGPETETRTASVAWALGDGTPIVLLEAKVGGYSLDFVRVLPAAKPNDAGEPFVDEDDRVEALGAAVDSAARTVAWSAVHVLDAAPGTPRIAKMYLLLELTEAFKVAWESYQVAFKARRGARTGAAPPRSTARPPAAKGGA